MEVKIDGKEYVEKGSGYGNSGDKNLGYWNSGDRNSGYWNSGDRNSGYWNSGDGNSGYWNSGDGNSGDKNSGNWNSGDGNSGFFNEDEPFVRMFGKDTDCKIKDIGQKIIFPQYFSFKLTEFVDVAEMTEAEKKKYPHYQTTNGFLRVFKYKEAWKNSFDKANKQDVAKTIILPNFDYKIFERITGITKRMIDDKLRG